MIDLHLHTTCSDGTRTPTELIDAAVKKGFSIIAITDHDTVMGLDEGFKNLKRHGRSIELIPGVELSTGYKGKEVHIIGLGIDHKNPVLQETLANLEKQRLVRIKETTVRLTEYGFPLTFSELPVTGLPGRAHVARAMVEKGYVRSVKEAFQEYLNPGKPGYVKRSKLLPKDAVKLIHQAKGLAFLAHPALIGIDLSDDLLGDVPVDGIEVFHSAHSKEQTKSYEEFALQRKLLISGGSDCHGPKGKDCELIGTINLPKHYFAKLRAVMDGIA